jgi:hypothetical protein
MKKLMYVVVIALLVVAASAVPAKADTLVYDNGGINGNTNAYTINFGWEVSDSFTLTAATSGLDRIQIGLWAFPGDTPLTVDWSIGTSFFGSDIASGAGASLTNTFQYTNGYGYDIYESDFNISTAGLGAGTYYLSLDNATTLFGNPVYWDLNNGPSSAMQNNGVGSIGSESFQVYGGGVITQTPEPASLLLLGSGLLGLAGGIRKRMKA